MSGDDTQPDLNFEIGYDVKRQKASFSIGISNIFNKLGQRTLGFSASKWRTRCIGKRDAKQGLPTTTTSTPDGRELDVSTQRVDRLTKLNDSVEGLTQDARDWVQQHGPEQRLNPETIRAEIDAVMERTLSSFKNRYAATRDDFEESIVQYENFQIEHGLNRPAEVPIFFLRPFVVLLGALLFETIANSFIFAGISTQGMIGGWATAIIVSVINILSGLVLGLLIIRYARIWNDWRRHILIVCGVFLVAFAVFFNLYVAHFREVAEAAIIADNLGQAALSRDVAPGFADAWPHFLKNPFNVGSVLGIGLLVIGLCIFGFASYEGYKGFTDPFPEYGKVGKRFYVLRLLRMDIEDRARRTANRSLDRTRARIEKSASLHVHFKDEVSKAVSFADRLKVLATNAEKRVNNHAFTLINAYRSANTRKRLKLKRKAERKPDKRLLDPGDPPTYFNLDLRLSEWQSVVSEIDDLRSAANQSIELLSSNLSTLDDARKYISQLRSKLNGRVIQSFEPEDRQLSARAESVFTHRSRMKSVTGTKTAA